MSGKSGVSEREKKHGDKNNPEIIHPERGGPRILLWLEPPGKWLSLPRPKTAKQLLEALNLPEEGAIVAREGRLLTPDRRIWPDEELYARIVASRG